MTSLKEAIDKKRVIVLGTVSLLSFLYYLLTQVRIPVSLTQKKIVSFYLFFYWIPLADYWQYIYYFILTFILLFIIPLILIKFYFKQPLKDYGFSAERRKWVIILSVVAVFLGIAAGIIAGLDGTMRATYPSSKLVVGSLPLWIFYEFCYVAFFYVAYETTFRGFLQFGLKREETTNKGFIIIVIIQTTITTLIHIGTPVTELFSALVFGLILGYIALKIKSIYPILLIHALTGVMTDIFCVAWSVIL